jgi:hypothetical protein
MTIRPFQKYMNFIKKKPFLFLLWVCFLALTSNTFKTFHHFLIWWVCYLSFFFLLYKTYYLRSLTRLSIVSIVKRGATVISYFWVIPQIHFFFFKKIKKIIVVRRCSKIQKLKSDSIFLIDESPVDKENSIWGRKAQNYMFMCPIKFYWRFNWVYGGFQEKLNFKSIWALIGRN